jgi:beta-lactamase regulating signal transducer with metallopeptidase domain
MSTMDLLTRFVIGTLLAGLWQAPLCAMAAWLVLRIASRANATTRHSVFAAALVASLVLPVATAADSARHQAPAPGPAVLDDVVVPRGAVPSRPEPARGVDVRANSRNPRAASGPLLAVPALAIPALGHAQFMLHPALARTLAAAWFAGSMFVFIRLFVSLTHLERLKRDALPLPIAYRTGLRRWSAAPRGSRNVRLCVSDEIEIPLAVGLFDAMILVPQHLLDDLAPDEIDSIVLHELAHLRRCDDWFNAVERIAHATLFFNPAILWLGGQLDLEREVACDDWVLQQNDALPYATCLAKVAQTAVWPTRAMTAPGAFATRRAMSIRIERLLAKQRDVRIRTSLGPAGATFAVLSAVGIVAAMVSPSIAYTAADRPASIVLSDRPTSVPRARRVARVYRRVDAPASIAVPTPPPVEPPHIVAIHVGSPRGHGVVVAHAALSDAATSPADARSSRAGARAVGNDAGAADADANASVADRRADASRRPYILAEASEPDYVDELASVGYTHLSLDELVSLQSVGVTAAFIRDLQKHGMAHPSVDELVRFRALGIDPQFVSAMRKRFGSSTGLGRISGLRAVGVTPDYIDALTAAGVKELSPERVMSLRALDVTPAYLGDLARAGYANLSVDDVQQLRAVGVDRAFIERARAHGFTHLSLDELVRLKVTGVL